MKTALITSIGAADVQTDLFQSLRHSTFLSTMDQLLMNKSESVKQVFKQQMGKFNKNISTIFQQFKEKLRENITNDVSTSLEDENQVLKKNTYSNTLSGTQIPDEETIAHDAFIRWTSRLFDSVERRLGISSNECFKNFTCEGRTHKMVINMSRFIL